VARPGIRPSETGPGLPRIIRRGIDRHVPLPRAVFTIASTRAPPRLKPCKALKLMVCSLLYILRTLCSKGNTT
jgi:hypothetical protein